MVMKSLGEGVSAYPKVTISILIVVSIIAVGFIGIFGIDQEFSESSFMPENEVVIAQEEVAELFSTSNVYSVTILVKDKNQDVLTSKAMAEMLMVERDIVNDSTIAPTLMDPTNPSANANSVADIVAQSALAAQGNLAPTLDEKILAIQGMNDTLIKQTITGILSSEFTPPQVKGMFTMLLTKDFSPDTGEIRAKGTMIFISLNGTLGEDAEGHGMTTEVSPLTGSEERMDAIVKDMELESTEMRVMGMSMIMEEIMGAMNDDMGILLPAAFILVLIILGVVFRNGWDILISLTALVMGILWMYGFGTALGFSFNPMTLVVPILIVGLGIDYGIHLTMRHREEIKKGKEIDHAVEKTIRHVGTALLLVTITTVAAFLSNIASPMDPLKDFGIIATIGIISCFFTMVTFVPAALHIKDTRKARKLEKKENNNMEIKPHKESNLKRKGVAALNRGISFGGKAAERAPIGVIIIVAIVSTLAILGAMNLETTFDFEDFLPEDLEISKDLNYMLNEFSIVGGEAQEVELLIKGDITNPALFRAVDATVDNMADDQYIAQSGGQPSVESINSLIRDWATNSTLYGFSDDNYDPGFQAMYNASFEDDGTLSSSATGSELKALYDWLYMNPLSSRDTMSLIHIKDDGGYDATVLRISITLIGTESKEMKELMDDVEQDKAPLESVSDSSILTGGSIVGVLLLDLLNESQTRTLILTLIVCLIFMVIVFYVKDRSFMLGVMTMFPVIFCVIWILGTMYIMDISLNIMTLMVTSLTIGIGVDYGIHISHRFGEDFGEFENIPDAMHNTLTHTGLALFGGATTTIAGFGLIGFASMPPIAQFGIITALTILYSSIASVFILPTFLVLWAKRKKRKQEKMQNKDIDREIE
ncbi:MAG: MMPL family transporter [Methanomassiliicoccales archaeon]|nr:MAG: MMPL family transporter [Methanomassiliicoccales archaeon]